MAPRPIRDEWLLPTLETLLSKESAGVLKTAAQDSYWESAVRRGRMQHRRRRNIVYAGEVGLGFLDRDLDPAQASADYRSALAAWQRRAELAGEPIGPRPVSLSG